MVTSFKDIFGEEEKLPVIADKPLLGFRKWSVDSENNLLLAATNNQVWQAGLNRASGCSGSHASPGEGCHCGFNAWYGFDENKGSSYSGVIGAFAGAGNIQLHSTGFRSSEAQVLALYARVSEKKEVERVAKTYGIPVFTSKKKFLEFVERFASPIDEIKKELLQSEDVVRPTVSTSKKKLFSKKTQKIMFWLSLVITFGIFIHLMSHVPQLLGYVAPGLIFLIGAAALAGIAVIAAKLLKYVMGPGAIDGDWYFLLTIVFIAPIVGVAVISHNANMGYTLANAEESMSKIAWAQEAYYENHGYYADDLKEFGIKRFDDATVLGYDSSLGFNEDTPGDTYFLKVDSERPQEYALFYNSGEGFNGEKDAQLGIIGKPGFVKANCVGSSICESGSWTPSLTAKDINESISGKENSIFTGMNKDWDQSGITSCLPSEADNLLWPTENLFQPTKTLGEYKIRTKC